MEGVVDELAQDGDVYRRNDDDQQPLPSVRPRQQANHPSSSRNHDDDDQQGKHEVHGLDYSCDPCYCNDFYRNNRGLSMKEKNLSKWKPGQSGNPSGRKPGTRNKATLVALALMEGEAEKIVRKVVDAAIEGDMTAARLVLERLVPPAREKPVSLDLPNTETAEGISNAQEAVLQAIANGELLPGEATTLATILENRRKALETQELEQRITALEAKQ